MHGPPDPTSLERQLRIYQERFRQLEYEVNTVKALALSTFARMGAYTLLVFFTLAVLVAPVLFDQWEPLLPIREGLLLAAAFALVIVLLGLNALQLSRGLRDISQHLRQSPREEL